MSDTPRRTALLSAGVVAVVAQVLAAAWVIHWWTELTPAWVPRGATQGYECGTFFGLMVVVVAPLELVAFLGGMWLLQRLGYLLGWLGGRGCERRGIAIPAQSSFLWPFTGFGLLLVVFPLFLAVQLGQGDEPVRAPLAGSGIALGLLVVWLVKELSPKDAPTWAGKLLAVPFVGLIGAAALAGPIGFGIAVVQMLLLLNLEGAFR